MDPAAQKESWIITWGKRGSAAAGTNLTGSSPKKGLDVVPLIHIKPHPNANRVAQPAQPAQPNPGSGRGSDAMGRKAVAAD